MTCTSRWLRWQAPYAAFCCAYFPVTLVKRVILRGKRGYFGLELPARRFWDKWGMLSPELTSKSRERPVWINMNSGGEVLMGWGLLEKLRVGEGPYILSTESYDSYELLCRAFGRDRTFFPPWDLSPPVARDLRKLQPRALVFVKYAYFPVLLRHARRAGIKTILVNGLLSRNIQVGNPHMQRAVGLEFYRHLDALALQGDEDYQVAKALGVPQERLVVTGDMHADLRHLRLSPKERAAFRQELGLRETDRVVIVGSTHPKEVPMLNETFQLLRKMRPEVRFIVAPRQIHEAEGVERQLIQAGWHVVRRSRFSHNGLQVSSDYDVLLLDTFGELRRLYGVADVAYIGASLVPFNERRAGHNVLEPLAHGVVPVFGPYMSEFQYATNCLLKVDPTLQVGSPMALARRATEILECRAPIAAIQMVGEELVNRQGGAVDRTVAFVKATIGE